MPTNFFFFTFLLIYNIVLVSVVQQSDSVIYIYKYIHLFRLFSITSYYKIMNIISHAIQGNKS